MAYLYIGRHGSWYSAILHSTDTMAGKLLVCFTDREEAIAWAGDYAYSRGGGVVRESPPPGTRIMGLRPPDEVLPLLWRLPAQPLIPPGPDDRQVTDGELPGGEEVRFSY
jgi:hypothetical protein